MARKKASETKAADDKAEDAKKETSEAEAPVGNGGAAAAAAAAGAAAQQNKPQPRFQSLAQYIKDLSVENPNSPNSLRNKQQPKININVSVAVNPQPDGTNEVVLKLDAKAGEGENVLFVMELAYAGLFAAENMTAEQRQLALMIEGPRLLFPFAREIIANATRQAGFPPLMLDPVDFLQLYRQRAMQAQQAQAAAAS